MKRRIFYVAANMDIWREWVPSNLVQLKRPPLWLSRTCPFDYVIRPYYLLTPKTYAALHQAMARLRTKDAAKHERLWFSTDPSRPVGFCAVVAATPEALTPEEIAWAESTTEPQSLPRTWPHLIVDGKPALSYQSEPPMPFIPLGEADTDPSVLAMADSVPEASKVDTPAYRQLVAFAPSYASSSGRIIFGRQYPSAVDPTPPTELQRRRTTPTPLAGKRRHPRKSVRDL